MLSRWTRYMARLQQRVEVAFARLKHLHARQCKGDSALFPRSYRTNNCSSRALNYVAFVDSENAFPSTNLPTFRVKLFMGVLKAQYWIGFACYMARWSTQ